MNILKRIQTPSNVTHISEDGVEIQNNVSTSLPSSVPRPDFPLVEFPSMEANSQSQIDFSSISDMLHLRVADISLKEGSKQPEKLHQLDEKREIRHLNISAKPQQSTRHSREANIYFRN